VVQLTDCYHQLLKQTGLKNYCHVYPFIGESRQQFIEACHVQRVCRVCTQHCSLRGRQARCAVVSVTCHYVYTCSTCIALIDSTAVLHAAARQLSCSTQSLTLTLLLCHYLRTYAAQCDRSRACRHTGCTLQPAAAAAGVAGAVWYCRLLY
jgi:hypothetical protein